MSETTKTEQPVVISRDGALRITPRHLTEEHVGLAREYGDYADDPDLQREIARGGRVGELVDNEQQRRWDNFVDSVSIELRDRDEALQLVESILDAVQQEWPYA